MAQHAAWSDSWNTQRITIYWKCFIPLHSTEPKFQLHSIWILLHHLQGKQPFPPSPPLLSPTQTLLGARPPKPTIHDSVLYWINQKIFLKLSNILFWLWLLYFYLTVKLHVYKTFYKHNTNNHWQFTSHLVTGKEKCGIRPSHILKGFEHVKEIQKIRHLCNILLALNY